MTTRTNNNLRTGFGISIALLLISSIISFLCIRTLLDSSYMVQHSYEVKLHLENTLSAIKDAETGQRGYLLTGDVSYLEPYNGSRQTANQHLDKVSELTLDNVRQQEAIIKLRNLISQRFNRLQSLVDQKAEGQTFLFEDFTAGKAYMDGIRDLTELMIAEENKLLTERNEKQERYITYTPVVIIGAALLAIVISLVFYFRLLRDNAERARLQEELEDKDKDISNRLNMVQEVAGRIAEGDFTVRVSDEKADALGNISVHLNRMASSLATSFESISDNQKLQTALAGLNERMVGERDLSLLSSQVIAYVANYTDSQVGALYLAEKDALVLYSGFALMETAQRVIPMGTGIVGQAYKTVQPIIINEVDPAYVTVAHGTGNIKPAAVIALPLHYENVVVGVLELAALHNYTPKDIHFLTIVSENIASALLSARNHLKLQELLEETQAQSEELQAQHSELENMNAELEAHTQKLQISEEELRVQQEELQQSNVELEERNRIIHQRNEEIVLKANALEQSTRYKSEFMANMSHELRTPLNSILLLSRFLYENNTHNLNEDQVESAQVIHNSGNGLLDLIDELLDLSKIEAGKMDIDYSHVNLAEMVSTVRGLFMPLAKEKQLELHILQNAGVESIEIDRMKLEQILRNLLSNAFKFTSQGSITLAIADSSERSGYLSFSVTDTGVGIPEEKQELVFEAFTQADGSTKRKYGGTGLGLSISRQLARLMGGDISIQSTAGKGSTFTLYIPAKPSDVSLAVTAGEVAAIDQPSMHQEAAKPRFIASQIPDAIPDDRDNISPGDKVILIVEDDTPFATALMNFTRQSGYKCLIAVRGDEGLDLALNFMPLAILLDIHLPVMDGWEVMEALKANVVTRHIPVHVMSSMEVRRESRMHGAVDFINKPFATDQMAEIFQKLNKAINKSPKKVLIVEENEKHAKALADFLSTHNLSASIENSVNDSISTLKREEADCVILDMGLPDRMGYDTLEAVKSTPGMENTPIIIFTGKNLSSSEEYRIKKYADSIVVKTAHSYRRILDEVALFLHLVEERKQLPVDARPATGQDILKGKTVLIADDDARNIFSLTRSLEQHQINVITATDGAEALVRLEEHPEINIVLMDMMMPQMDGYESTTKIRQDSRFRHIPVIAVTAKAMLGDREKCIAVGASDYISKPVDIDQLISLLRVWLYDKQ